MERRLINCAHAIRCADQQKSKLQVRVCKMQRSRRTGLHTKIAEHRNEPLDQQFSTKAMQDHRYHEDPDEMPTVDANNLSGSLMGSAAAVWGVVRSIPGLRSLWLARRDPGLHSG